LEALCGGYAGDVRKRFFFEKKQQKLLPMGAPSIARGKNQMGKVFWFFFSKKNFLLSLS
jgi:hypothetical protein